MGGPGAFVMTAEDFGDFAQAILGKLVREVASLSIERHLQLAKATLETITPR